VSLQGAGGLFVTNDAFFLSERDRLVSLAAQASYSRDLRVTRILRCWGALELRNEYRGHVSTGRDIRREDSPGVRPSDLPVMQPTKYELVINLKTAKALGLDVPPLLLARADEVIE
jgi:putative tryptophan/tyrosine transport system substrate-binding protein